MRILLVACVAILLGLNAGEARAAQKSKPMRTVQVIAMTPAPKPAGADEDQRLEKGTDSGTDVPAGPLPEAFRTHDLSRQWVAFEMANSFASNVAGPSVWSAVDEDPFARVGIARLGPGSQDSVLPPPPAIAIPAWMREGRPFSVAPTTFTPGCAPSQYRPTGFLSAAAEIRRFGYYGMMSSIACEYGIPVGLFDALIIRESRYKPDIYSGKNAFGLTQLMPDTAVGLGVDRYDVEQNLRGGARYLRQQLDSFGQIHLALAAYNAGPGRVRNGLVPRIAETQAYVDNVLLNWQRLAGLARRAEIRTATSPVPPTPRVAGRVATISSY